MSKVLALLLFVACSGGSTADPHERVECGDGWNGQVVAPAYCELACVEPPTELIPNACASVYPGQVGSAAMATCGTENEMFEFAGIRGCCVIRDDPDGNSNAIRFFQCAGQ